MKNKALKISFSIGIIFAFIVLFVGGESLALTTEEMLRLKKAGISEEIIVLMVENGYKDADKVLSLKDAGFKDESIMAIIKGELKSNTVSEKVNAQTTARVKILWYLIYRGNPVLQNSRIVDNATISLVDDTNIKIEWKEKSGLGLLDEIKKKTFKSPFYWSINKDDAIGAGAEGYAYILKSGPQHQGKPETDNTHYWEIYFDPRDAKIVDHIKHAL